MNIEITHETENSSGEILCRDIALLDIFFEENQNCHNLREMNTSITRCINILQTEAQTETQPVAVTPKLMEAIGALLRGEELRDAEKLLVADMNAIPKEIRQKIKKGVLRIAESKQINGNVRAAIVDSKNMVVKQITLKQGTGNVLSATDLNMLAVQVALRDITERLECIDAGVQYLITLKRRGDFQTPFFDAMNKVIEAKNARNEEERHERIQSAIDNLNHGLNGLYGDLSDCVSFLDRKWIAIASKRNLSYISEDMVFIPQYVALLVYLYHYLGRDALAEKCIHRYQVELDHFASNKLKSGYTAAQLVHSNYEYNESNINFWIDGLSAIREKTASLSRLLKAEKTDDQKVICVSFDDEEE